uniref:Uncharacterized protein n=1 Tax=Mustela putorius furo TaxID=9669 RepID=M3YXY5_MUSPF
MAGAEKASFFERGIPAAVRSLPRSVFLSVKGAWKKAPSSQSPLEGAGDNPCQDPGSYTRIRPAGASTRRGPCAPRSADGWHCTCHRRAGPGSRAVGREREPQWLPRGRGGPGAGRARGRRFISSRACCRRRQFASRPEPSGQRARRHLQRERRNVPHRTPLQEPLSEHLSAGAWPGSAERPRHD